MSNEAPGLRGQAALRIGVLLVIALGGFWTLYSIDFFFTGRLNTGSASNPLAQFLKFGCPLGNKTLFRGIRTLEGGSVWTFEGGSSRKRQYFTPAEWERQTVLSADDFQSEFEGAFKTALPRYLRGNSRIGISLTGGLDSRMIMACLPALEPPPHEQRRERLRAHEPEHRGIAGARPRDPLAGYLGAQAVFDVDQVGKLGHGAQGAAGADGASTSRNPCPDAVAVIANTEADAASANAAVAMMGPCFIKHLHPGCITGGVQIARTGSK
jgi:hypothetical protein